MGLNCNIIYIFASSDICIAYVVKEVVPLMAMAHKRMHAWGTDYTGTARKKAGCKNCNKQLLAKRDYKNDARIFKRKKKEHIAR